MSSGALAGGSAVAGAPTSTMQAMTIPATTRLAVTKGISLLLRSLES
jgi:hypothetical protein